MKNKVWKLNKEKIVFKKIKRLDNCPTHCKGIDAQGPGHSESYNYSVPHSCKKMAKNPEKGSFK